MENTSTDTQKKLESLSAEQILALPISEPEWLFSSNLDDLKREYRQLAKLWHPDVNKKPQAENVFRHIDSLRNAAEKKINSNSWLKPGEYSLTSLRGEAIKVNYSKKCTFSLGEMFVAEANITYLIRPEHKDLFENALATIKDLPFADKKMKEHCGGLLPQILTSYPVKEGYVLVVKKEADLICLRDCIDHYKGALDSRHVAWILSSSYNLTCYLSWAQLTHNDISPENIFISPKNHYAALLGGWWYAVPTNHPITYLPERSYGYLPSDVAREGCADPRLDLGLVRLLGREMLGDPIGLKLAANKTIPASLTEWLRMPTSGEAKEDYSVWTNTILKKSFGARRYTEMNLTFSDIYNKGAKSWVSQPISTSPTTPPNPSKPTWSKSNPSRPHP